MTALNQGGLSTAWKWADSRSTADSAYLRPGGWITVQPWLNGVHTGFHALAIGRLNDGAFTVNALDLNLNISAHRELNLSFWLKDFYDENHEEDGIWMSDDGGESFKKCVDFFPAALNNNQFHFFSLNLDSLLLANDLQFSSQFIIRFQQGGVGDFNTSGSEDGIFLDDVRVEGQLIPDAPVITFIDPNFGLEGQTVVIKGSNFQNASLIQFNGITADNFQIIDNNTISVVIPNGATTGLVSVETPNGTAFSPYVFTILKGC